MVLILSLKIFIEHLYGSLTVLKLCEELKMLVRKESKIVNRVFRIGLIETMRSE